MTNEIQLATTVAVPFQTQRFASAVADASPNPALESGLELATVISVDHPSQTAVVQLDGQTSVNLFFSHGVSPVAGRGVWVARMQAARIIIGSTDDPWVVYAADLSFTSGVYTKGNAAVEAHYMVDKGLCHYYGKYVLGSTTTWPGAGALMRIIAPFATSDNWSRPIGEIFYNHLAAGSSYPGRGYSEGTVNIGCSVDTQPNTFVTNGVPYAWAAGDEIRWDLHYRV